jgi:hypothetical protein
MNPPNSPCECGSGRKQKKCHPFGAPRFGPEPKPIPSDRGTRARTAVLLAAMLSCGCSFH